MKNPYYLLLLLFFGSCNVSNSIVEKPIVFNAERIALTKEYMKTRYGIEKDDIKITPKMIVLHWTAIPTFKESFEAFCNPTLPKSRGDITNAGQLNVSSQFLVDRDGTIYRLMPENEMARHVIGLNYNAIGVENVGGTGETPLTTEQLKANIKLVEYLSKKYDIDYLIGHYEYTNFEDSPLWLEKDDAYRTKKTDPGKDFMNNVRKATKNLNFNPVPIKRLNE